MRSLASLEAIDLACVRGGRPVFAGLGFSVAAGNILVIEGPNGSGKTSTLRIVAGLLAQSSGMIRFRVDAGAVDSREERGRFCGWLGHQDAVKTQLTVGENVRMAASLYGLATRDTLGHALDHALDRVGLSRLREAPAQYLSAGQRRRLALARLLVTRRPVWLLDEPFASLDADGRSLVGELVHEHCAMDGIVMAATHEPLAVTAGRIVLGGA